MLTDTKARGARAKQTAYKIADRDGLYMYVTKTGAKSWRLNYRFAGKQYTLTLGLFASADTRGTDEVLSLAEARDAHAAARKLLAQGVNPAAEKQRAKAERELANVNTVRAMGEAWFEARRSARSQSWADNARRWLDQDIFPALGGRALRDVAMSEIESLLAAVSEKRGARSAECVRFTIGAIYKAAPRSLGLGNLARDLAGTIEVPKGTPRGRPLSEKEIPAFLEAADRYAGRPATKIAFRLLMLTFVRKAELIEAPWTEIDLERAEWVIPAERMKAGRPHVVPLSAQAVECFRKLKELSRGSSYVFPNLADPERPMNHSTLNVALDRIGYGGGKFTPHGARSTASTALNSMGWRGDVIELQLAHTERNLVRAAYNHSDFMQDRRAMMQQWADYLDTLAAGANVIPLKRTA